jgi:hypothetical protein
MRSRSRHHSLISAFTWLPCLIHKSISHIHDNVIKAHGQIGLQLLTWSATHPRWWHVYN